MIILRDAAVGRNQLQPLKIAIVRLRVNAQMDGVHTRRRIGGDGDGHVHFLHIANRPVCRSFRRGEVVTAPSLVFIADKLGKDGVVCGWRLHRFPIQNQFHRFPRISVARGDGVAHKGKFIAEIDVGGVGNGGGNGR